MTWKTERVYLRLLQEKRVDGIIVGSHNVDIEEYEEYGMNIVSIDREFDREHSDCSVRQL